MRLKIAQGVDEGEPTEMRTIKILVVDDFAQWRSMLRSLLEAHSGFQIIAEATNGWEAIKKAAQLRPDVVLLDIGMPPLNGLEAAPRIRRASPDSEIIFLTQQQDDDIRTAALATGAAGYLLKSDPACELVSPIHAAMDSAQPHRAAMSPSLVFG
jgi:two-component system, NarL family, nitrate/nitrite response regulator NarL